MNITVRSGDAYSINGSNDRRLLITVTKDAVAVDLTGVTMTFLVKRKRSDADGAALITKTVGSGITLASPQSGATKGLAYITLAAGDTSALVGGYQYELQATDAVGVITLADGGFQVRHDLVET